MKANISSTSVKQFLRRGRCWSYRHVYLNIQLAVHGNVIKINISRCKILSKDHWAYQIQLSLSCIYRMSCYHFLDRSSLGHACIHIYTGPVRAGHEVVSKGRWHGYDPLRPTEFVSRKAPLKWENASRYRSDLDDFIIFSWPKLRIMQRIINEHWRAKKNNAIADNAWLRSRLLQ